ncbi:MAG: hypothetical protein JW795_06155 [Chitinivibrionales bacterium]|nr:hypothetical protein [Chitinivibrionales bacterium]
MKRKTFSFLLGSVLWAVFILQTQTLAQIQKTAPAALLKDSSNTGSTETPSSTFKMMLDSIFADQHQKERLNDNTVEIDGLIINQTRSRSGQEFYEYFYTQWDQPFWIHDYSVTIVERPVSSNRNVIFILVNDNVVSSFFLKTRRTEIISQVQSQLTTVYEYLQNLKMKEILLSDEIKGSGI